MTRRQQFPNITRRCHFYKVGVSVTGAEPEANDYGEIPITFALSAVGLFAKEKPTRPSEAEEGDRTISEQRFTLTARYTKSLSEVTLGQVCYINSEKKLYAVNGNATDPYGDRQWIQIQIVDNVTQDIAEKFPGAPI